MAIKLNNPCDNHTHEVFARISKRTADAWDITNKVFKKPCTPKQKPNAKPLTKPNPDRILMLVCGFSISILLYLVESGQL